MVNRIENDIFNFLDSINPNSLQVIFKSSNLINEKFSPLIKYLNILNQNDKSISELFYNRMKYSIKNELLDSSRIKNYLDIIQFIKKNQNQLQKVLGLKNTNEILEFFEKILKHLNTNSMDADSSIIGLSLMDSIIKELSQDLESLKSNKNKELLQQITKEDEFIKKLANWNSIENPVELVKEIRNLTSQFRSMDKLKQGDIVVVRFTTLKKEPSLSSSSSFSSLSSATTLSTSTVNSKFNSLFQNTKIIPNRYTSSHKRSIKHIPIISLDDYYNKKVKYEPSTTIKPSVPIVYGMSGNVKETSHGQNGIGKNFQAKAQFARFTGEKVGNYYLCYFSSKENEAVAVSVENILMLNKRVADLIKENDKSHIKRMIHQPSDDFLKEMVLRGKEFTVGYLKKMNIDLVYIQTESDNNGKPNLLSLNKIKFMKSVVQQIMNDETHQYYSILNKEINTIVNDFLTKLNDFQLYLPNYKSTIDEILNNPAKSMAQSKLSQIKGEITMALDRFNYELHQYINCNRKNEVQSWWSKLIESKCNEFLEMRNFNLNYTDNDINVIIDNFKIIRFIINHVHHKDLIQPNHQYSPMPLIDELKNQIYPVINQFIEKCKIVFMEFLKTDEPFTNIQQIKLSLQEQKQLPIYEQLQDLLSDLEYLEKMKILEDEPDEKEFHIVPISHLVINHFLVLSQHLQNNIEIYSPENYQSIIESANSILKSQQSQQRGLSSQSESSSSTSAVSIKVSIDSFVELPLDDNGLHVNSTNEQQQQQQQQQIQIQNQLNEINEESQLFKSIKSNDFIKVNQFINYLIENVDDDRIGSIINQIDSNGWSPIHFACSIGNEDICNSLLNVHDINVHLKTKEGASVLHLLVRHPFNEKRREIYNKILSKGLDINTNSGKYGETPLHSASLRGDVETIKYLLEKGANVNAFTTNKKETSLHYAVIRESIDVVNVLLLYGANISIASSNRGTPLDIARNSKYIQIINKLESHLIKNY